MFGDFPKDAPIRMVHILDWILENGEWFEGVDMASSDRVVDASYRRPELKSCYHNSLLVRGAAEGLSYYEGWAGMIIPVPHAWNVLDEKVVDVTMTIPLHREKIRDDQPYFGVKMPWDWVWGQVEKETRFRPAGSSGPFVYDYAIERIKQEREEE